MKQKQLEIQTMGHILPENLIFRIVRVVHNLPVRQQVMMMTTTMKMMTMKPWIWRHLKRVVCWRNKTQYVYNILFPCFG